MKRRLALHLLASLLAAVPAAADIRFHSAPAYGNRLSDSDAAVIGDFNGDGRNDIALVRGSSLLVMFGTAAGQLIEGPAASVSGGQWVCLRSSSRPARAMLDRWITRQRFLSGRLHSRNLEAVPQSRTSRSSCARKAIL